MNEQSEIELMQADCGTAITINQRIAGWVNKTVDDKVIVSVGDSKKVVDAGSKESYIDYIKQMIGGGRYEQRT